MSGLYFEKHKIKSSAAKRDDVPSDGDDVQHRWIKGLVEQIEFANRPEVLPDYFLDFKIGKRRRLDV